MQLSLFGLLLLFQPSIHQNSTQELTWNFLLTLIEAKRLGVQPQNGIPDFILHFPLEPSYGYLRFEGNEKIPLER